MNWSSDSSDAPEVVLAYSPRDNELKTELGKQLDILQLQGAISGWHERSLANGEAASGSADDSLNNADLVLLLISSDFVCSEYCYGEEIQQAVKRHDSQVARLVPILGRPVPSGAWTATPFGTFSPLPQNGSAVTTWDNRDEAFADITNALLAELDARKQTKHKVTKAAGTSPPPVTDDKDTLPTVSSSPSVADNSPPVASTPKIPSTVETDQARNAPLRVFVSSTFEDLKTHRARVIDWLRKSHLSVDPMEDWTASTEEPKEFSKKRVEGCQLCVLLVGFRRGYVPEGEQLSITQMEHRAAVELGIDVLPFLLRDDAMCYPKFDEREKDSEIVQWRQSLQKQKGVGFFTHEPESLDVGPAIMRWLQERQASHAADCIENLADLMKRDSAVRDEAIKFRTDFQDISRQVRVLGDYKDLHDLLHDFELKAYNVIVHTASYFPDNRSREHLSEYEFEARKLLDQMDEVTDRDSFMRSRVSWMSDLLRAREVLLEAIEGPSEAKLREAIRIMRRVLALEPAKIDRDLNMLASQLSLCRLVQAMRSVCERVSDLQIVGDKQARFNRGAQELQALEERLRQLVEAHFRWQDVDASLRRVEASLDHDLDELIDCWPSLKSEIEPLYEDVGAGQSDDFRADAAKLDDAIGKNDEFKMRQYFRRYRAQCTHRFYETDKRLRDLCGKLRDVATPLDSILEILR